MMPPTIIFKEKYGVNGYSSGFVRSPGAEGSLVQVGEGFIKLPQKSLFTWFVKFLIDVFLPQGYPESVREDYCRYQIWDTIQAFCSTISGILTTHAIMKSVGVGDASASALSATLTWVLKDGIGMIGRIMFTWWRGHALDTDSKKWRLFADLLNDAAMFLELLLLPMYPHESMIILCLTTSMKGIVGVAAGASRAAITQHHALRGNNGDVSAKDGSQETCVNLVASVVGMALLSFTQSKIMVWTLFTSVTLLHVFANYKGVKSLNLVTFNTERLCHFLRRFLVTGEALDPREVNQMESVIVGLSYTEKNLCGYRIVLGQSLQWLVERKLVSCNQLLVLAHEFRERRYLLVTDPRSRTVHVLLQHEATTRDVLQAYLHAVLVAITICQLTNVQLDIFKECDKSNILNRIAQELRKLNCTSVTGTQIGCPVEVITVVDLIIDDVFLRLYEGLKAQGWSKESHSLLVDEWRGAWTAMTIQQFKKDS